MLFQAINSKELVYALIACFKAGLIPVCTLPPHREHEIGYLGCHADARAHIVQGDDPKFDLPGFALAMKSRIPSMRHIISLRGTKREGVLRLEDLVAAEDPALARAAVEAIPRDPFQVAIFQLSGGTTGVPKIIPRMQNDYLLNATLTTEWLGFRSSDVMFIPMPIIHNACLICFLMPTLLTGAAFALPADLTPKSGARSSALNSRLGSASFAHCCRASMPWWNEGWRPLTAFGHFGRPMRHVWCGKSTKFKPMPCSACRKA